ncbi:MAG TPA: 16S rRNA (cytosine(1402)-N(4))-methyltransferase RsmH [Actinobacteria bacterium]|nr:16S rRNA (cytosine(1402)-N(4))-methyltransferase RsmH [Actinomycetota bacterium]
MEYLHKSVLPAEVSKWLRCTRGSTVVDCTLGGAGHSETILNEIAPDGFLLGIDKDEEAIVAARARLERFSRHFEIYRGNFADIDDALRSEGILEVDGFLLDLGMSSYQLADETRGFSYQMDAPLDMRFDKKETLTAAKVINEYTKTELGRVIKNYGEDRWASRIAKFCVQARGRRRIETTGQLIDVIKDAIPASARRSGGHPARKTFQALRIEVNQELVALEKALVAMPKWLKPGGRIVIISYHSLEDRMVKKHFKELAKGCICPPKIVICACGHKPVLRILTGRPVRPTEMEVKRNPRARSARLRVAEKVNYASS